MAGSRTLKLSILADIDNLKKNLNEGDKEIQGFGGKLEKFGKVAAAAFAAAAAAAVAYAGKLAIDGVKAAIEDEAAQLKLANALKQVTGATDTQIASIEKQISAIALATGVADDALRPAFQRLAVATGDVSKAQDLLNIALDVSAATGKPLETVTNALGKAYEGNTASLGRLGVGMGTAEIKALGLEGTVSKLAETFAGAADVQANSFQGRMERVKVAIDEAKETIGTALLPILDIFLKFITENVLPVIQRLSDAFAANKDGLTAKFKEVYSFIEAFLIPIFNAYKAAFDRIQQAVIDNRERFKDLLGNLKEIWDWVNKYLVPLFRTTLVLAIEDASRKIELAIKIIVPVVKFVTDAVKLLINGIIDQINNFIKTYNLLNGLWNGKDVGLIQKVGSVTTGGGGGTITTPGGQVIPVTGGTAGTAINGGGTPIIGGLNGGTVTGGGTLGGGGTATNITVPTVVTPGDWRAPMDAFFDPYNQQFSDVIPIAPQVEENVAVPMTTPIVINVNAPSVIDSEGFSRAVVDALNRAADRTGGGGLQLAI